MIALTAYFVCIGLLVALPAFAIPSPDFLGPLLGTLMALIGFASAALGGVLVWFQRIFKKLPENHRKGAVVFLVSLFVLTAGSIGGFAWHSYQSEKTRFQNELKDEASLAEEFSIKEQEDESIKNSSSTQAATSTPLIPPVASGIGAGDLISSRVASSTLLVPTSVLKDIVAQPNWSDRILLLDIREVEEREVALITATTTVIRYGDLLHGALNQLPKDRDILAVCWTSIRGKEIATWLRANGFLRAFAIDGGLQGDPERPESGWINNGLPWSGKPKWSDVFGKKTTYTLSQAKALYDAGAYTIDLRSSSEYEKWHVQGAQLLTLRTASSVEVDRVMKSAPAGARLLIYCNEYVNCFYAKILGVRMSRLGYGFEKPFDDVAGDWKKKGYPIAIGKTP